MQRPSRTGREPYSNLRIHAKNLCKDKAYEKAIVATTFASYMQQIIAHSWSDYKLLDFGQGYRLEKFADKTLLRPDINVPFRTKWKKGTPKADASFTTEVNSAKGSWAGNSEPWELQLPNRLGNLKAQLKCTPHKHVGIFPEQVSNWNWIDKAIGKQTNLKVLNLFAYTGLGSLVLKHKGCDVVHVESSKSTLNWAKANMERNKIEDIRWCLEDAFLFIQRELRRGNKYHGIIMDPPAFGSTGKGKRWMLEDQLETLIANAVKLLDDHSQFFVLNTYSPKAPYEQTLNWLHQYAGKDNVESGSLCLQSESLKTLHTGNVYRFNRI